jgi:deferrochelatase/peroxidase EfeB
MKVTRRSILLGSGGAALGLAATAAGGYAVGHAAAPDEASASSDVIPFDGPRQAGIATPSQARLVFASFDVVSDKASDLSELLAVWTDAARKLTLGQPIGPIEGPSAVPPDDTGEATGLPPSALTLTVGVGPSLFTKNGEDRLGLAAKLPSRLRPLPALPGDVLDPARTGGDLCVQACADDPQVAFHAVRNLLRVGRGIVELRWLQLGFAGNTRTTTKGPTPRNLLGFKDGTRNLRVEDEGELNQFVWVGDEEPQAWFRGGTYIVARRIRMLIESWDRDHLGDQENVIGRYKESGAPLTGTAEFDEPDFAAKRQDGQPVIPTDAHIRLAAPEDNGGMRILRRGYAYTDGIDPRTGLLDAGLFFIAFQKDPDKQFVAIQRKLGLQDGLMEYLQHTGGGIWAVLPGAQPGQNLGSGLFA